MKSRLGVKSGMASIILSDGYSMNLPLLFLLRMMALAKNVFGEDLLVCSADPMTGFFRTGKCETCRDDHGMHTVCVEVTAEFLKFSKSVGNDLSTPVPEYRF